MENWTHLTVEQLRTETGNVMHALQDRVWKFKDGIVRVAPVDNGRPDGNWIVYVEKREPHFALRNENVAYITAAVGRAVRPHESRSDAWGHTPLEYAPWDDKF